jgi:hypothetical protein
MLKLVFEKERMSRIQRFEWFLKFKSEMTSVEDAEYLGCPPTSKTDENVRWYRYIYCELVHKSSISPSTSWLMR